MLKFSEGSIQNWNRIDNMDQSLTSPTKLCDKKRKPNENEFIYFCECGFELSKSNDLEKRVLACMKFGDLPNEVLEKIMHYMDSDDLASLEIIIRKKYSLEKIRGVHEINAIHSRFQEMKQLRKKNEKTE